MIKKAWNTINFLLVPVGFFALGLVIAYYNFYEFMGMPKVVAGPSALLSIVLLGWAVSLSAANKNGPKP